MTKEPVVDERTFWEWRLAELFRCPDCHGRGKRDHAIWPKIDFRVSDEPEIIDETAADYVAPRVEFRKCATCKGTGKS